MQSRSEVRTAGAPKSSDLIRQADRIADAVWPDRRHYTYVSEEDVGSGLVGDMYAIKDGDAAPKRGTY